MADVFGAGRCPVMATPATPGNAESWVGDMTADGTEPGARLRVVTYGGGKQSTVLVHMAIDGLLPALDAVIFADTQNEMPSTYEHLDYMKRRTEAAGIPFLIVSKGDLWYDVMTEKHPPTLPAHAINAEGKPSRINGYNCSYDYKRRIVQAAEKRLCGKPGAWKRATVEQWVGYTTDEMSRCKRSDECRCGHKRAASHPEVDERPAVDKPRVEPLAGALTAAPLTPDSDSTGQQDRISNSAASEGSAYEPCSGCGGHGHVDGMDGIRTCPYCHGDCYVRARDKRGRFTRG